MRILYISQYFPPEMGAPAARVHEFSREWVRMGHEVCVMTAFAHHPTGVKAPEDRGVWHRADAVDGIRVERTYVYATANQGIARRMLSYASFMASAVLLGTKRARAFDPDIVIATSPQLLCAAAGRRIARVLGRPFVFEVRDLWPESIIAVEAMTDNLLIRRLKALAASLYRDADRIVTVGDGYRRMIHQLYGVAMEKMDVVTNGIDAGLFVPGPRDNEVRREFGWQGKFVLLYLGTHGMAHALGKVLEAARDMAAERRFVFAFVGEGAEKHVLKRQAADWGLSNVVFVDQQPKERVRLFYAACDLGLVTLRKTELFQEVLPSKIFEYLGMARPVLISVDGQARSLVEEAGAGCFVPPEDVGAMCAAVRRLAGDPQGLAAMGERGRRFVLEHFDRRALARRYLDVLERVGRGRPAAR